ncbi:neural Wiskott-Aldrich syndrome protein-like [Eucalyptus grandis]|uniref:neural Wiskott-Aldrich syndrome protein-like n=1 Tax=Eucalyptus grandis TaxID=71139 RepID=UPI00192E7FE6|nr:neural Wiskott-Aldrich syndrome protein-like [Eucalyptus grandis]
MGAEDRRRSSFRHRLSPPSSPTGGATAVAPRLAAPHRTPSLPPPLSLLLLVRTEAAKVKRHPASPGRNRDPGLDAAAPPPARPPLATRSATAPSRVPPSPCAVGPPRPVRPHPGHLRHRLSSPDLPVPLALRLGFPRHH